MAEKRYYWLKLKEDFFNDIRMKRLRKISAGSTYTIIYLKLLLLSLKDEGKLLNNIKMQTSGDDDFSTFTLDWRIQYLPFLICSNQECRCWFASHFLHLQTYW